jgi:hypothetical protein
MGFNEALFWNKVNKTSTCWLWTGYINSDGYGEYASQYLTTRLVHRISYGLDKGYLPALPLDHLCRHRHCVHPDHLEAVESIVNTRRSTAGLRMANKTHCPQGHPYDEENTILYKGKRKCRACKNERARQDRAKTKQASAMADKERHNEPTTENT